MQFPGYLSYALTDLLKQEAGISFIEFALIGSLALVFLMLLLLAWDNV